MKETERILQLFKDGYAGSPWLDVNLVDMLQPLTAAQAAKKIAPQWNTIWEIVQHIISWRSNVLERVKGRVIVTPGHNYFFPVKDITPDAWMKTLQQLEVTQQEWIAFLHQCKDKELEKLYPSNELSYYEHMHGILQHDAYHLGQIVLLAKAF